MNTTDDTAGHWWQSPVGATLRHGGWNLRAQSGTGQIVIDVGDVELVFTSLEQGLATTEQWGFAERATDPATAAVQHAMEVAWSVLVVCGGKIRSARASVS